MSDVYNQDFYLMRHSRTAHLASRLSEIIVNSFSPCSAVDLGCGVGTVLQSLKRKGCTRILGIEGPWVQPSQLVIDQEEFKNIDFTKPFRIDRTFDVALSLEVAEHFEEEHSDAFIDSLCRLSDKVIFSAAIPHQGGTHHVNERWQSHWAKKFSERGYLAFDFVRPQIWNDELISYWYRQNSIAYIKADVAAKYPALASFEVSKFGLLDRVHPELYLARQAAIRQSPLDIGYRELLKHFPSATWAAVVRATKRRMGR